MMKKITNYIPSGSAVLAATTLLSYILGLVRDRQFAHTFGASMSLDAYNAAFLLPDFLFNIFVASGIAAAVIPITIKLFKQNEHEANNYLSTVILTSTLFMAAVSVIILITADWLSVLVSPGFSPHDRQLVASLMRLLSLSPILFAASNALGAALVAKRRFFFYGLSPVFYNLGIIGGTILLSPMFGIYGVALGTLCGAVLHMVIRAIDAYRCGLNFKPLLNIRTPEFKKTIALMIPKMVGHPVELATFWVFTAYASFLASGSIAILSFARNFQSVPVSVIGIVIGTTSFPLLSSAFVNADRRNFTRYLVRYGVTIALASVVAGLLVWFLRESLIRVFLGGKAFGADDILRTAAVLGIFCLSIPTESISHLCARAWYATENTTIPVVSNVLSFICCAGIGWLLLPSYGLIALPIAFFVGSIIKILFLLVLLPAHLNKTMGAPQRE